MVPWIVAPAVTGTLIVPGARRVTLVLIIGRGSMIVSAIMFGSPLAVLVLVRRLRADG